jgi:hypothetical protein
VDWYRTRSGSDRVEDSSRKYEESPGTGRFRAMLLGRAQSDGAVSESLRLSFWKFNSLAAWMFASRTLCMYLSTRSFSPESCDATQSLGTTN